ncbi:unnamed protein product [Lepeophtheirus salmonis]|uniref:(salmon louse) hypothetical protein n=1 Tax=Lepeophtheirus salmonis TaxID=72036 RepID=A0A7R8CR11_LEPSM|nr:unnamed protein product [Lepeophtheirus salmonis]CAF2851010.1 unnamed protein product [Lepeophtheirus salmonis]
MGNKCVDVDYKNTLDSVSEAGVSFHRLPSRKEVGEPSGSKHYREKIGSLRKMEIIELRNGWTYNPTPRQFRAAFRKLLGYAGKNVLSSATTNCVAQDETVVLSLFSYYYFLGMSSTTAI